MNRGPCVWVLSAIVMLASVSSGRAADDQSAEATVRALVRANAEKDMETMSRLIAHDADITSYTIGGRKYVGWGDLERDMEEEFKSATTIEIPIRELKVWTRGDVAWYAMEIDCFDNSNWHISIWMTMRRSRSSLLSRRPRAIGSSPRSSRS